MPDKAGGGRTACVVVLSCCCAGGGVRRRRGSPLFGDALGGGGPRLVPVAFGEAGVVRQGLPFSLAAP